MFERRRISDLSFKDVDSGRVQQYGFDDEL
jgi:hypothetical protein